AIAAKVIGISLVQASRSAKRNGDGKSSPSEKPAAEAKLQTALAGSSVIKDRLLSVVEIPMPAAGEASGGIDPAAARFMSLLGQELPNEARIEMIRISRDREAQI